MKFSCRITLTAIFLLLCNICVVANSNAQVDTTAERIFADMRKYFNTDQQTELYNAADEFRTHALKVGNIGNYYKGWETEVLYDINFNRFYQAMKKTQRMSYEMRQRNDKEYFFNATHLIGIIHSIQGNNKEAIKAFKKALTEADVTDSTKMMSIYIDLANVEMEHNQTLSLEYADKALSLIDREKMPYQYSDAMAFKTIIAFVKKDWDLVNQCYEKYIDVQKTDSAMFSMTYYRYATLGKLAADGKYAEAAEMANEMTNIDKYKFLMLVYEAAGDTAKAYLAQKDYITVKDSITQNIRMEELQGAAHDLEVASHISETRKTKAINIILCIVFIGAGCIISVLVFHYRKRKQYTKELEQKNKELTEARIEAEKAEDLKLSIMKNMSHEIRSPLNVISGFAQVIGNSEFQMTESLRAELAGMVQKSTDSITNILNELLDISDNGAKYGKVKYNEENLLAICHEAAEKCRKKVVPGIEVNVTSALPDDFMYTTNREELLKAMECILDNARKFTETGTIAIDSRKVDNGNQLEISITDTGCGIEEGEEDLIFDHFYKSDKHKEGIGLGLTLARRIIYHLNGNLTLDTSYKNGARFLITLPMEG